jgi:thiol-disulfide isomerase/thioredoxin
MKINGIRAAVIFFICLYTAYGCAGNKQSGGRNLSSNLRAFPQTEIPSILSGKDRIDYLIDHYWDIYLDTTKTYYSDSTIVNGVKKTDLEKAVGAYVTLLDIESVHYADKSVSGMFDKVESFSKSDTSSHMFDIITKYIQKYLYDPNSPVRNEDYYLPYVTKLSKSSLVDEPLRKSYAYDARMCALNRTGTPATDFEFTDLKGKVRTLYSVQADYTLLFFSNPGCNACKSITEALESNGKINGLIKEKKLAIVNIYIDLERDKWRAFASSYPESWYNGYDNKYIIRTDVLYNVRAIPSLYILDKDKKVIMKDAPQEKAISYLDNIVE